jgi:biotin-(acetyl-CoA carboxylase) ligase
MWDDTLLQTLKSRVEGDALHLEVHHADEVSSTNDWAWEYYDAVKHLPFLRPALFLAEAQHAGRGTHHRSWVSPPNTGMYATVLYPIAPKENLAAEDTASHNIQPLYTRLAALAIWAGLTELYPSLKGRLMLRHVNDLYIQGAKLGGILVESRMNVQGTLSAIVTGVGINNLPDSKRRILDGRNLATTLVEHLPQDEVATMLSSTPLGEFLGAYITGVYGLFHEGELSEYEGYLALIREPSIYNNKM